MARDRRRLALTTATLSAQTVQINGAGATFPNPIYTKWFSEYNKLNPNVRINYQSLGSGAGIRQLTSRTVFFGATDAPMTDEQCGGARQNPASADRPRRGRARLQHSRRDAGAQVHRARCSPTSCSARLPSGTIPAIAKLNAGRQSAGD